MDNNAKRAVIEAFIEAYNDFDIEGMVALLHPQCQFRNVASGEVNASAEGIAAFRELAEQSAQLFSARCQRIRAYREESDVISVDIDYEGILRADVPAGRKAGEVIRLQGRSVYRLRDGRIYELTDYS